MRTNHLVNVAVIASLILVAAWLWLPTNQSRNDTPLAKSGARSANLVSSIEPISSAEAADSSSKPTETVSLQGDLTLDSLQAKNKLREQLGKRFAKVNQLVVSDQTDAAVKELKKLINEFPTAIEPYINLAALYSKSNQLELARQTLNQGIEANPNTAMLFASRQKVLGVQAARAYQTALNKQNDSSELVLLPYISNIAAPAELAASAETRRLQNNISGLNRKLSELQIERDKLAQDNQTLSKEKAQLAKNNDKLELERSGFVETKSSFDQYKTNLEVVKSSLERDKTSLEREKNSLELNIKKLQLSSKELEENNQKLQREKVALANSKQKLEADNQDLQQKIETLTKTNQSSNAELMAKVKQLETDKISLAKSDSQQVASLQTQLKKSQESIADLQQQHQSELAQLTSELTQLRKQSSTIVASTEPEPPVKTTRPATPDTEPKASNKSDINQQQQQAATALVKRWAADWSAQNVDSYVSRYTENYSPPRGDLNHQQWLEQRRIRLTNKKFINIDVSDIDSKDLGEQFAVTFSQHYRSNTVDDKIVKRLTFIKNGDDWSNAKIVDEVVVSR